MKMDKLENFINSNREAFDSEEMPINWVGIRKGMHYKPSAGRRQVWLSAAATVTVLFFCSIFFLNQGSKISDTDTVDKIELPSKELIDQVDPSLSVQMDQFVILIQNKQNELNRNLQSQPELYKQFLKDNNRLDSSYNYLKSQLAANPNKEILLDAMIENLQLKLEILNRQLLIIKQSKNKKTDNESKTI
jgi:hypothetical protein